MDDWMGVCNHGLLSTFLTLEPILNVLVGEKDILPMSILREPVLLVPFGSSAVTMEQVCLVVM